MFPTWLISSCLQSVRVQHDREGHQRRHDPRHTPHIHLQGTQWPVKHGRVLLKPCIKCDLSSVRNRTCAHWSSHSFQALLLFSDGHFTYMAFLIPCNIELDPILKKSLKNLINLETSFRSLRRGFSSRWTSAPGGRSATRTPRGTECPRSTSLPTPSRCPAWATGGSRSRSGRLSSRYRWMQNIDHSCNYSTYIRHQLWI